MEEYIKQMQDYLNKNSIKSEENDILKEIENNLNKNEEINDEEDFDFQQIINNNENQIKNVNNKEEIKEKQKIENKNIDEIPITGNNKLNFNELLEKELSKEQNEGNYNNEITNEKKEPKFKYIPKKKVDIVSAPTNTKKYKYYSDNFKQKKKGNLKKDNNKETFNEENEGIKKYEKKKERVAPVMPDNFKNSIFNRGKGYTGPINNQIKDNNNELIEDEINDMMIMMMKLKCLISIQIIMKILKMRK